MHFHPPLAQIGAELAFRSSVIAFSQAFWDLKLLNDSELPAGPCFIYGNHSNNYDPFILNAFTDLGHCTAGVMTLEYLRKGPLAALFKASGIVGTQKRVPEPHLIRQILKMIDQGRRIVIFPEGGRRWDVRPAPWIESTAKLFIKMKIPVYPVRIHGSYAGWPRWAKYPRPAKIQVEICPPVDFSDNPSLQTSLNRLKEPISQDENIVSDLIKPSWAFRPADGISKLLYRDPWSGEFDSFKEQSGSTVQLRTSGEAWTVLPDSTLRKQESGEIYLSGDLYDQIRSLPITSRSDESLFASMASISVLNSEGTTCDQYQGKVTLWADRINLGNRENLSLEDIRYTGLEKSDKIWLVTSKFTYHIVVSGGVSALAWQDVLHRLNPRINGN